MAKRNKKIARAMRSGTSPYARYGKRPYRYSPAIRQWQREMGKRESEFERQEREREDRVR